MLESRLDDKDKEQYDTLYWSEAAKGWIKRTWVEASGHFSCNEHIVSGDRLGFCASLLFVPCVA